MSAYLEVFSLERLTAIRMSVPDPLSVQLRGYLVEAKIFDGETPQSFRVGLCNTLRLLGCSQQEVA